MTMQIGSSGFVLFLVFLVLKLCNVITWSWWWVTSPLWVCGFIIFVISIIAIIIVSRNSEENTRL